MDLRYVFLDGKRITCNMTALSIILKGKWKPLILWQLKKGISHFGELKRVLEGISGRILAKELQELVTCHVLEKKVIYDKIKYTEYSFTSTGKKIFTLLDEMCNWSNDYLDDLGESEKKLQI